jgi:hypothetical protein
VNVPPQGQQTCIAGDIRPVEAGLAASTAPGRVGDRAQPGNALRQQLRLRLKASQRQKPVGYSTKAVFRGIEVRDGRIAHIDCHERFDLLFNAPEFENRDLVEPIGLEPTTSCLQSRRSTN